MNCRRCGAARGGRPVHVGPVLHMRTSTLLLLSLLVSAAVAFSTNAAPAKSSKFSACMAIHNAAVRFLLLSLLFAQVLSSPSRELAASFRDRSGGFRKPFKKSKYEMIFADGPYGCTAKGEDVTIKLAFDLSAVRGGAAIRGLKHTKAGAKLAILLLTAGRASKLTALLDSAKAPRRQLMLAAELRPRFAVFVSGFVPRDVDAAATLLAGVDEGVPSLHIFGASDELVVPERSKAL